MRLDRALIRKSPVIVLLGGLLVFALIVGLRNSGNLEYLELSAYDWFVRLAPKAAGENQRLTLIEVSEQDIQSLGAWPLSDAVLAEALEVLLRSNPRAIGLDIYRDIPVPPGSEQLARLFIANPGVVGVMTIGDKAIAPPPAIKGTAQAAFGDVVVDPGGIVRRGLLFLDDGQEVFTSFAMSLAVLYLAVEGIAPEPDPVDSQLVRLGKTTIRPFEEDEGGYRKADARGYQFLLDFKEGGRELRSYSLSSLLSGAVPDEAIADRVVLIGVNAQSVKDYFFTPLSRGVAEGQQISGIALHGQMTGQLLRFALDGTPPIKAPSETLKVLWLLAWSLLGSTVGFTNRSAWRFSLWVAGGLLLIFLLASAAFVAHWWIPLIPPVLGFFVAACGVTAYVTGREKRERAALMEIFSKHVSKEVAGMIWEQRDQFLKDRRPRSQNMMATVFFSDLRGFTSVSEKMPPEELIEWLNTYMEAMAGLIMQYGGVVDSYAGDGIKADFGVPIPRRSDAEIRSDAGSAVACALAMEGEMARLNRQWGDRGLPEMGMRIGIFTGPVVGGLLGSSQRMKYTTIGDTVNVASRLESFDKEVGRELLCRILIGDTTLQYLDGRYETEKIGEVRLKGKAEVIKIHRVLGPAACGPSSP